MTVSRHLATQPLVSEFPRQMTSEKRAKKFYTDDASLSLVETNFPRGTTNQKHYPDLGSDARHQHAISVLVSQTTFGGKTSGSRVAKFWLFSQAKMKENVFNFNS